MTSVDITRHRPGFAPEYDWTCSEWHRACEAAARRSELIARSTCPIPGEVVHFPAGISYRLTELDGNLLGLPTSDDDTGFAIAQDGTVDYVDFYDYADAEFIDPAEAIATGTVQPEYTMFQTHNREDQLRMLWVPERVWRIERLAAGATWRHGDRLAGRAAALRAEQAPLREIAQVQHEALTALTALLDHVSTGGALPGGWMGTGLATYLSRDELERLADIGLGHGNPGAALTPAQQRLLERARRIRAIGHADEQAPREPSRAWQWGR